MSDLHIFRFDLFFFVIFHCRIHILYKIILNRSGCIGKIDFIAIIIYNLS